MKLEEQVCSLELAKRLKELGVKQESLVYWLNIPDRVHMKLNEDGTIYIDENNCTVVDRIDYIIRIGSPLAWNIAKENTWSAFTVAELGEMLPSCINQYYWKYETNWYEKCIQYKNDNQEIIAEVNENTEANSRAMMLIYLIENKLIEVSK